MAKLGDRGLIAANPDVYGVEHRVADVVAVHEHKPRKGEDQQRDTVDVLAWEPTSGTYERLNNVPVYGSRQELDEDLEQHLDNLNNADGIAHPLKDPDTGKKRQAEVVDLLPWHNGWYPLTGSQPEPRGEQREHGDDGEHVEDPRGPHADDQAADPKKAAAKRATPAKG